MEKKKSKAVPKKKKESDVNIGFTMPLDINMKGGSHVEIKRNSKGVYEFSVKVSSEDPKEAFQQALSLVKNIDKKLPFKE